MIALGELETPLLVHIYLHRVRYGTPLFDEVRHSTPWVDGGVQDWWFCRRGQRLLVYSKQRDRLGPGEQGTFEFRSDGDCQQQVAECMRTLHRCKKPTGKRKR